MADVFETLIGQAQQYGADQLKTDPYALAAKGIAGGVQAANFSNPWANVAAQALGGFGAGMTNQAAQNNYDANVGQARDAYMQAVQGQQIAPEFSNSFAPVQAAMRDQRVKQQQKVQDIRNAIGKDLFIEDIKYQNTPEFRALQEHGGNTNTPMRQVAGRMFGGQGGGILGQVPQARGIIGNASPLQQNQAPVQDVQAPQAEALLTQLSQEMAAPSQATQQAAPQVQQAIAQTQQEAPAPSEALAAGPQQTSAISEARKKFSVPFSPDHPTAAEKPKKIHSFYKAAPTRYELLSKHKGNAEAAESELDAFYKNRQFNTDQIKDFDNRLGKKDVQDFFEMEANVGALLQAFQDPSAAADVEIIRGVILTVEQGLAVRNDDQEAVIGSQAIPQEWKAHLGRVLDGTATLGPELRDGLARIVQRRYGENKAVFDKTYEKLDNRASQMGIKDLVLNREAALPWDQMAKKYDYRPLSKKGQGLQETLYGGAKYKPGMPSPAQFGSKDEFKKAYLQWEAQ